jgi:hypothetical protein
MDDDDENDDDYHDYDDAKYVSVQWHSKGRPRKLHSRCGLLGTDKWTAHKIISSLGVANALCAYFAGQNKEILKDYVKFSAV